MDKSAKTIVMALAGNPNSGKTTIFNILTGARQHVGNYPGVTVERKEGFADFSGEKIKVVDLPGTYSLTAYSPDEMVARRVLLDESPDVVVQIVDAGNLERNLYLAVQIIAMRVPTVLAFNMMDEAAKRGIKINLDRLSNLLGVPIVPTVGCREEGVADLLAAAVKVAREGRLPQVDIRFGSELDRAIEKIRAAIVAGGLSLRYEPGWLAIKLLEADREVMDWISDPSILEAAKKARTRVVDLLGDDPEILLADARYGWVHGAVAETVSLNLEERRSLTDRVDTVVANRVLGLPIFLALMWLTFTVTFRFGAPAAELIERLTAFTGGRVAALLSDGLIQSLLVDGIIAGVGGVLVFLPNIVLLFLMVTLMEDSGYMARAAFIVDKFMHVVGLHGKSFIPLFVGFGCNVPAIMGTRILESERDRRVTILITPFISCSARLPVYVLLTGAFFPARQAGNIIFSLYILGIAVALIMARVLGAYIVKGQPTPFVMELPPYRMPTVKSVVIHLGERAWLYIKKAGTIIMAVSILVWFLSNFPLSSRQPAMGAGKVDGNRSAPTQPVESPDPAVSMRNSYAGKIGDAVAPALRPLGLGDWKIAVSLLTGAVAKEVVVSTMATLYSMGDAGEDSPDLRAAIAADKFFTPLKAYTFMVFILLYVPCLATLAVAYRELGSWKWLALMVALSMGTAYTVSALVYWGGRALGYV